MAVPPSTTGERLHTMRRRRMMTQKELAQKAGVSVRTITMLEQGLHRDVQGASLRRLARALDCTVDWLVGKDLDDHEIIPKTRQDENVIPAK